MEATGSEMFAEQHILEGGELMLAKMVEERDKNKPDLFLQEMDNLDKFLDGAEALRPGHDQSSSGMDDLLQLSYGDLVPMKDIPMMIEGRPRRCREELHRKLIPFIKMSFLK